jgi:anti-sigma B factor antagonist
MSTLGFEVRTARLTPGTYVVSVTGEIDMYTSPALDRELDWILGEGGSNAVVDLAEVGFIDSTALTVLLKALRRFERGGGSLILATDDRRVLRTLEVTGLDAKFKVEEKLADAIARLTSAVPS